MIPIVMHKNIEAILQSSHPIVVFSRRHISFVKFLIVGSLNTAIDIFIFSLLANILNIYPPIASIISAGLTLILSFFLNHNYVFRSQKKRRSVAVQFVAVTLFNVWVIQTGIIALFINEFEHTSYFVTHVWTLNTSAKLCGVAVSFILNFLCYRYIFREKSND